MELPDRILASNPVLYGASASISSSLGSFANLGSSALNPTAQKWNILCEWSGKSFWTLIHFLVAKPKSHAYVQGIVEICKLM